MEIEEEDRQRGTKWGANKLVIRRVFPPFILRKDPSLFIEITKKMGLGL